MRLIDVREVYTIIVHAEIQQEHLLEAYPSHGAVC